MRVQSGWMPHIASRIFGVPLMIEAGKLGIILSVLGEKMGVEMPEVHSGGVIEAGREAPPKQEAQAVGPKESGGTKIAIIPVYGTLVQRTAGLGPRSGMRSYEDIRRDFRAMMNDPEVSGILFDIDSPGGEASGVFDLADEIYQARGQKTIYAIANETALSAAYAIASAADRVYMPRTGMAGSIGVIAVHMDQSGFDANLGVRYTPVFAGSRKNDFSPHEPLNPAAYEQLKKMVDESYQIFVETVARNRGISVEKVIGTEAAVYHGANALQAGLVDGILSYEQTMNKLAKKGGPFMSGHNTDAVQADGQTPAAGEMENISATTAAEGGEPGAGAIVGQEPVQAAKAGEELDAAAERARVTEIMKMCRPFAGRLPQGFMEQMIKDGVPVEQASTRILEQLAKQSEADPITSTVGAVSTGEVNPIIAEAKRRRDAAAAHK
jgi:signal peptide peptidase SppA